MSSRSLAAARARRAGENAPPVSGNRPGTSIGSHAAFSQQQQPGNVRVQQNRQGNFQQPSKQENNNNLPFSKLSISDAIGLITLRLGRVEQYIIETEHENEVNGNSGNSGNLPENSRIIDNSILTNIINRLDSLEKKEPGSVDNESITKLTEQLTRIGDEVTKHNLAIAKHTEQLFKFDRDLTETKDILKTFMIKYDKFTGEVNDKFGDYEFAIAELEKNVQPSVDNNEITIENVENVEQSSNESETSTSIMSVDLKKIISQELASSEN
jgi:hypothetical protein